MFDLSQIVEKISGLFEPSGAIAENLTGGLAALIRKADDILSALENAPIERPSAVLFESGIDPTNLADGQIVQAAQDLVQPGSIESLDLIQPFDATKEQ